MLWWVAEIISSHGHIFLLLAIFQSGCVSGCSSETLEGWDVWEGGEVAQCALVNTGVGEAVGFWERKTRILEF